MVGTIRTNKEPKDKTIEKKCFLAWSFVTKEGNITAKEMIDRSNCEHGGFLETIGAEVVIKGL